MVDDAMPFCTFCGSALPPNCLCGRPVPVQQDEPEGDHWHWLDDRTGRIYHEGDVFGVRSGRDVTLHRLRCTCDPVPEWIVDNAEAKGWDLSPEAAPLPRTRPPRSHRDDESLRRWEARHPSVRFRPTVPLEQECEHEWRSSFGDTFCEKCNQDAPVPVQQDEPEGLMCSSYSGRPTNERCTKDAGHGGLHEGEMLQRRQRAIQEERRSCVPRVSAHRRQDAVPDEEAKGGGFGMSDLREKIAQALWDHHEDEAEARGCARIGFAAMPPTTQDVFRAQADACLSVLHEAGTLQTSPKTSKDLDLCDECGCIGLCDPRCSLVPVQQDEPEGVDEDLQREIESTRRALKGGMWLTSHGLLRARVRSAVNQMASTGLLPATRVKLEAALAVDVARGVPQKPCPVPVQQDEPEGVCAFPNCSCTENRCPGVGGEPCRGCGVPTGVGAYHHIGCRTPEPKPVPVQQDEPEAAPLPRSRPPRSHRDDESLRRWEARHPSVRFRPTVPLEQEPERCEHDWVVETRTASIKVCQSCGMEQAKNMDDAVVGLCAAVPSVGLNNDGQDGELLKDSVSGVSSVPSVGLRDRLAEAIWEQQEIQVVRERSIPWAEINRRDCQDREWTYEMADAALSVLYEAGTQGCHSDGADYALCDSMQALAAAGEVDEGKGYDLREAGAFNTFHIIATDLLDNLPDGWALVRAVPAEAGTQGDSLSQLVSDTGLIREVARVNVELCDLSEKINEAVARWMDEAKRRKERLTAVSGTPDTGER